MKHSIIYTVVRASSSDDPLEQLRRTLEQRGDTVIGAYADHGDEIRLRQRNIGWRTVLASLDGIDVVAVTSAGDLPGRSVKDLIKTLNVLRDKDVGLFLMNEGIETGAGSAYTMLDIIKAYRTAKLSQAIRRGQIRAVAEFGRRIGRPSIPVSVQARIRECLGAGHGIRSTARRFNVCPASVVNIRRSMLADPASEAA